MLTLATPRLALAPLTAADAAFILALVNEPDWLRYIGDRGVRSLADAGRYLADGPIASYARHGFGLLRVGLKPADEAIGICGLVRRDTLDAPDLGFAFLPGHRGRGYAVEAGSAVLAAARATGVGRVLAITTPDNHASMRVLARLGFVDDGAARGSAGETLRRFAVALAAPAAGAPSRA